MITLTMIHRIMVLLEMPREGEDRVDTMVRCPLKVHKSTIIDLKFRRLKKGKKNKFMHMQPDRQRKNQANKTKRASEEPKRLTLFKPSEQNHKSQRRTKKTNIV